MSFSYFTLFVNDLSVHNQWDDNCPWDNLNYSKHPFFHLEQNKVLCIWMLLIFSKEYNWQFYTEYRQKSLPGSLFSLINFLGLSYLAHMMMQASATLCIVFYAQSWEETISEANTCLCSQRRMLAEEQQQSSITVPKMHSSTVQSIGHPCSGSAQSHNIQSLQLCLYSAN